MSTSAQLPLCVYCGTPRPADRSECPKCARPWIDVRVGRLEKEKAPALVGAAATSETPGLPDAPVAAAAEAALGPERDLTVDLTEDVEETTSRVTLRRAIPIVLGLSAVAVVAMFAVGLLDEPSAPAGEGTTAPETTAAPVTTTAPTTTVTTPPTTTAPPPSSTVPTTTIPDPAAVGVWGEPVALSRLALRADAVGPIAFGTPSSEAIGRLVASLGTPEEIGVAGVEHGLCADEDGRFVRWAELVAIVSGTLADGTFVGYRFQAPDVPTSHLDLATPSGIHLGDDLATLTETYARYSISYETVEGASTFQLTDDGTLLLWGPISSTEESGRIEGIYSPLPCDQG